MAPVSSGAEGQPWSAGRKRQRQVSNPDEVHGIAGEPGQQQQSTNPMRQVMSITTLLRRPGQLQRASGTLQESEEAKQISREVRFLEGLPLKAPYVPEEVCDGCGKTDCECDPDGDSEDMEEEPPKNWRQTMAHKIRRKTDVVRDYAGRIVNDQGFQIFIVILILINSLFIGLSTFDFIEDNPEAYRAFRILDLAFLIIFTIELILQFLYLGYSLFFDGWLVFDLFIVLTSWFLESISVLRALKLRSFRIFRAFRLTTRIRVLRRLVEAILDVLPKISAIIVMFMLILYIFSVMCTELFGDIDFTYRFPDEELAGTYDYFSRMDYSLFTLFVMVTLDWAKVARAVMQEYSWAWAIFCTFVTFSSFVLYNLIIAVVCDAVKMVQDQQDIFMVENYVKDKIESRHRIINLRQKLDKMSKQQMDLLLYVQLMLEQVEEIDEASKQHYEETLLMLGQSNENARDALQTVIEQLDRFEGVVGNNNSEPQRREPQSSLKPNSTAPAESNSFGKKFGFGRRRRVSFQETNSYAVATSADDDNSSLASFNDAHYEDARDHSESNNIDESFHSCAPMSEGDTVEVTLKITRLPFPEEAS